MGNISSGGVSPDATYLLEIVRGIKQGSNLGPEHALNRIPELVMAIDQQRADALAQLATMNQGGEWMQDRIRAVTEELEREKARVTEERERAEQVRDVQQQEIKRVRAALSVRARQHDLVNQRIAELEQRIRETTDPQYQDRVRIVTAQRDRLRARLGMVLHKNLNAQHAIIMLETAIPDTEYCVACWGRVHDTDCPIGRVRRLFGEKEDPDDEPGHAWTLDDDYDPAYDEEEPDDPTDPSDDGTWGNGDDGY